MSPAGGWAAFVAPSPSPLSGQQTDAGLSRLRALFSAHPKGVALMDPRLFAMTEVLVANGFPKNASCPTLLGEVSSTKLSREGKTECT